MAKKKDRTPRHKHVPQRMCVACRERFDKRDLTRIVATPDGQVLVDPSGKRNGRGAYLCSNPLCWQQAVARKLLDRALKVELTTEDKREILDHQQTHFPA